MKFSALTFDSCDVPIGKNEPEGYSGQYWLDTHYPVYNIETGNQEASERMYCCDGVTSISISKFVDVPPVAIVQIHPITQVFMLPSILHIGDHTYTFQAAICGNNVHFTATIKFKDKYYKFDDMRDEGVFEDDSADFAESAIYSLIC